MFGVTIFYFHFYFSRAFRSGTCGERTRGGVAPAEDHRVPAEAAATRSETKTNHSKRSRGFMYKYVYVYEDAFEKKFKTGRGAPLPPSPMLDESRRRPELHTGMISYEHTMMRG